VKEVSLITESLKLGRGINQLLSDGCGKVDYSDKVAHAETKTHDGGREVVIAVIQEAGKALRNWSVLECCRRLQRGRYIKSVSKESNKTA
jgi:hypothetical protein